MHLLSMIVIILISAQLTFEVCSLLRRVYTGRVLGQDRAPGRVLTLYERDPSTVCIV